MELPPKKTLPILIDRPLSNATPLGRLLNDRQADEDFRRMRRLAKVFDRFHLKHTTTGRVQGRGVVIDGRAVINFGSFNYLGLEQHPAVLEASKKAIDELGTHSGCSRVFSSHENIIELEAELAELVGAEAALIGHNVTQIHAGVLPALFSQEDSILFLDRHAHTSIYQASQIAMAKGARVVRVDVSDIAGLKKHLRRENVRTGALLVDGVYSMQGHIPDLMHLSDLCREHGIILYVDDAHGIGVFGLNGGGVREACALSFDNLLLVGSLQKALGTYGGFVAGHAAMIQHLRLTSKAYIFSGTLQPAAVAGAREAVRIARSNEGRRLRQDLAAMSRRVRRGLRDLGFSVPAGDSPIVPVLIGTDTKTLMAGRKLFDEGIYLNSVLFPAVPRNQGILRISLTALHSESDLRALLEGFVELKRYLTIFDHPTAGHAHLAIEIFKSKLQGGEYAGL